jgi:hypothetical protein
MTYPNDPGYERNSQTSKEAAEKMKHFVGSIRARCYRAIELHGVQGMTPDEGEVFFGGKHQTISARFTELAQQGKVIKTSVVRKTRSGCNAFVHIAPQFHEEFLRLHSMAEFLKPDDRKGGRDGKQTSLF